MMCHLASRYAQVHLPHQFLEILPMGLSFNPKGLRESIPLIHSSSSYLISEKDCTKKLFLHITLARAKTLSIKFE